MAYTMTYPTLCPHPLMKYMLAPKGAVVRVVVVVFVDETRSVAAVVLGHGVRTLADGVLCKFTGKQKS